MASLSLQMRDWRLTTAEILYHLPDHPHLLQSFTWQEYDLPPAFPQLRQFLAFWDGNIEGKVHSVTIGHLPLVSPGAARHADCLLSLQ